MEEDKDEKRGGAKNTSDNSYVAPTSTIVPPFFRYQPTDRGFRFCGIPQNPCTVRIISPYLTGIFCLCMTTTYILVMHHVHVLCATQHLLK